MRNELTTVRLVIALASGLPFLSSLGACSPSAPDAAEISTKFDEVLAAATECELPGDCIIVYPGCPLGQFAAVNRTKAVAVDEAARALLRQYAREDQACAYQVTETPPPDAVCEENKCVLQERAAPPDEGVDGGR